MFSVEQAKQMAAKLKASLELREHKISYSSALEMVSHQLGFRDWNTAVAMLRPQPPSLKFSSVSPYPSCEFLISEKRRSSILNFSHSALSLSTGLNLTFPCIWVLSAMVCSCIFLNTTVMRAPAQPYLSQ